MARPRGAIPAPRHVLARLMPHVPTATPPDSLIVVPPGLQAWGNHQYGDCVTAEECAAKAADSFHKRAPEILISNSIAIEWASRHGVLNGAMLPDVMDMMASDGIIGPDGTVWKDGGYSTVDWTSPDALKAAICTGPVKLGVAANQLEQAYQGVNGWHLVGASVDQNLDHCVSLFGYGTASDVFKGFVLPVPQGIDPSTFGYILFTWGTLGFVDQATVTNISGEAYVRNPTTPGLPAPPPPPTPPVNPVRLAPGTYAVNGTITVD